ncbi:MAG: hypothetical protein MZV63_30285 [Marinilabiliales bacterium]|nr:hypothetical protein [Marinilabiliales bacterium]
MKGVPISLVTAGILAIGIHGFCRTGVVLNDDGGLRGMGYFRHNDSGFCLAHAWFLKARKLWDACVTRMMPS